MQEKSSTPLCQCGCGEKVRLVYGRPNKYVRGHQRRKSGVAYLVEDRGYETPCWIWQRGSVPGGYGVTWDTTKRKQVYAHRLSFETHVGPIPDGMEIDHKCHIPPCINPKHLRLATRAQQQRNTRPKAASSVFKGVSQKAGRKTWVAFIRADAQSQYIGSFRSEVEAAQAYDKAARALYGEFAVLNFPEAERWEA